MLSGVTTNHRHNAVRWPHNTDTRPRAIASPIDFGIDFCLSIACAALSGLTSFPPLGARWSRLHPSVRSVTAQPLIIQQICLITRYRTLFRGDLPCAMSSSEGPQSRGSSCSARGTAPGDSYVDQGTRRNAQPHATRSLELVHGSIPAGAPGGAPRPCLNCVTPPASRSRRRRPR